MVGAVGAAWHSGSPKGKNAVLRTRASLSPAFPRDLEGHSPHCIQEGGRLRDKTG